MKENEPESFKKRKKIKFNKKVLLILIPITAVVFGFGIMKQNEKQTYSYSLSQCKENPLELFEKFPLVQAEIIDEIPYEATQNEEWYWTWNKEYIGYGQKNNSEYCVSVSVEWVNITDFGCELVSKEDWYTTENNPDKAKYCYGYECDNNYLIGECENLR